MAPGRVGGSSRGTSRTMASTRDRTAPAVAAAAPWMSSSARAVAVASRKVLSLHAAQGQVDVIVGLRRCVYWVSRYRYNDYSSTIFSYPMLGT